MTRAEWLALLLGVPATIIAASVVATALIRWNQDEAVFGALKRNPNRWSQLARESGVFNNLYAAADLAERLGRENERLHTMIVEKLTPLAELPTEFAKLAISVQHFSDQVGRMTKAIEDVPERIARLEERSITKAERPRRGQS